MSKERFIYPSEIEEKILDFIEEREEWDKPNISISFNEKRVLISFERMYSFFEPSFALMKMLSEWFETDHINLGDHYSRPGCDTCDYGSSYKVSLSIWKIPEHIKVISPAGESSL